LLYPVETKGSGHAVDAHVIVGIGKGGAAGYQQHCYG